MNRRASGTRAEDEAARFLTTSGYIILDRNWRTRFGELDIVAVRESALVFVEVRSRSTSSFGEAIESIDAPKVRRLRALAAAYMQSTKHKYDSALIAIVTVVYRGGSALCTLTWLD